VDFYCIENVKFYGAPVGSAWVITQDILLTF